MKIALIGYGAMGKLIRQLAEKKGYEIIAVFDDVDASLAAAGLAEKLSGADVAIDFSTADAVRRNVEGCISAGVPLVEGTTGWSAELNEVKRLVHDNGGSFVFGANFSIGVNLFYRVVAHAAELMAAFPEYQVFLEEQHHSRKLDAPSGTALKLKSIVGEYIKDEFGITATRAGSIPGTHRVGFDAPADQILLEHTARSREGFAAGALLAAEWVVDKKGFYEFTEVMDEICKN